MKIIIVGCGKVGQTLATRLNAEGHNIVLVDTNGEIVQSLSNSLDVIGVVGNGGSYSVQIEAGIEDADLLLAVTTSDELNLLCCLIARKAGNCRTIARVRNPIYKKEANFIRDELGLSLIINPEEAAANEMSRILSFPSAIEIDTFAKGRVELLRLEIPLGSVLHNQKLMDLRSLTRCDVLVCAVERDEEVIIPNGSFVLNENDKISIIATHKDANEFIRKIGIVAKRIKNTMIVGGGTITYYLAKQLLEMGIEVKIIEKSKERCEALSELLPKAVLIQGDGTNLELLMEEGLETIDSFVSMTNVDEENILLTLVAGKKSKAKMITKVNRISFEDIIDRLNIGSLIYPKHITADNIMQYVRALENASGNNVETLYKIVGGKAEALAFKIKEDSEVCGVKFEKLHLKKNLLVCCIVRKGKLITPRGQDMIQKEDTVIVVTTNTGLNDLEDILA